MATDAEAFARAGKASLDLRSNLFGVSSGTKAASIGVAALNMALSALTAMAIQFAIQAAIKGFDQLQNGAHNAAVAMKETADKSAEQASNSAKELGSLDDLISKYDELAKSGIKDADTRAQVRDIQSQINELVGSESGQIDLVNGSYREQLALLQQIRAEKANEAIQNSYAAYSDAKKAADNVTGEQDGGFLGGKGYSYVGKYDPKLERALRNAGFTNNGREEEFGFIANFGFLDGQIGLRTNYDKNGNAISGAEANIKVIDEALQALEDAGLRSHEAYSALVKQRSEFQEQLSAKNQQLDVLLNQVIDTYRDFDAESKGVGGDTADAFRAYYAEIIDGVLGDEWLQEAIQSGDLSQRHIADVVLSALSASSGLSKGYSQYDRQRRTNSILNGLDVSTRGNVGDDLISYINSLSDEDLKILLPIAIDPNSRLETKEQVRQVIEDAKNIPEVQKISFKEFYSGDTIKDTFDPILKRFTDAQSAITAIENGTATVEDLLVEHPEWSDFGGGDMQAYLKKYAADAKKAAQEAYAEARKGIAEEELAAYDAYVAAALQQYETTETLNIGIDIDVETKSMDAVISSIKSSVSQLGLNNEQIAQLQSRYKDIAGYFPDKLFEKTTNGIHLNTDALMKLESAYEDQKKLDMQTNLEGLRREYAALTTEINKTDAAGGDTTGLYKQRSAIEAQINALTVAQSEFEALTSTYNKWKQAQSMGEEGDMFDDIQSNLKNIKELYDEGLIGTNKFKSAIELMTGKDAYGMSSDELISTYDEAYPKMQKYFAEGTKGSEAFLKDLEKIGAATKNGDQWSLDLDAEEVAKQLGVSADLVEIMVRKLADYNFDVDLSGFGSGIQQYATDIDTAVGEITHSKEELTKSFESGQISTKEYVDAWKTLDQYEKDLQQIRAGAEPIEAKPLSLDEAIQQIEDLQSTITTLSEAGIDVPVTLSGDYDALKEMLVALGGDPNTSGSGLTFTLNDPTDATTKITEIQQSVDRLKATSTITASVKATLIQTGNATIDELKTLSETEFPENQGYEISITANDEASDKITSVKDMAGEEIPPCKITLEAKDLNVQSSIDSITQSENEADVALTAIDNVTGTIRELINKKWDDIEIGVTAVFDKDGATAYKEYVGKIEEALEAGIKDRASAEKILKEFFGQNGGNNLTRRPVIPTDWLIEAGYDEAPGGTATVRSESELYGQNREIGVVLTPILPNGEPVSSDNFDRILDDLIVGTDGKIELPEGDYGLGDFDISDIVTDVLDLSEIPENLRDNVLNAYGEALHQVQETFYDGVEPMEAPVDLELDQERFDKEWAQFAEGTFEGGDRESFLISPELDENAVENVESGMRDMLASISTDDVDSLDFLVNKIASAAQVDNVDVGKIESLWQAYDNLRIAMTKASSVDPANTDSVESAITQLQSAATTFMQNLNGMSLQIPDIELNADTNNILAAIASLAIPDAEVTINPDDSAVESYVPKDKDATVKYTANFAAVTSATVPKLSGIVEYHRTIVGASQATGTAYADGTAYRGGIGRAKGNGVALGGELGEELVVRNGKFFSIGENGAEFFKYRDGDIIFNASQTEELLRTGKIRSGSGRGRVFGDGSAYAEGTAFALVKDTFGKEKDVHATASGSIPKASSKSSSSKKSSKKKKSSSSSKADTTSAEDLFDWIEVAIDRVERAITNLGKTASSTFKSLATRLSATDNEISTIYQEIATQQAGAARYMQQAESVALSPELKALVQNGAIDITQYDEDTQKLIKDYQEWYEKSLACSDAVQDLHENLGELYEDRFKNIEKDFDNQLSMIEHRIETFNNAISESEYSGAAEPFANLIASQSQSVDLLRNKLANLQEAQRAAVASGEVTEGSEAWYEMQDAINSVNEELQKTELEITKIFKDAFDAIEKRFGNVIDMADDVLGYVESVSDSTDFSGDPKPFAAMMAVHRTSVKALENELDALEKSMADALNSGRIKEGSDAWFDMQSSINAVKKNIIDTGNAISKLYKDVFDDIEDRFKNVLSLMDNVAKYMEAGLDEIEKRGYLGGVRLYTNLAQVETKNIEAQTKELERLREALDNAVNTGEIKEGSSAWYEMKEAIASVMQELQKSNLQLVEYNNSIRQLKWDAFDRIQDRISGINDEAEFMIKLMESSDLFDDKGQVNGTGKASIGLHAMEYDVYMAQADKYADEVKRLNAEIANDPYNNDLIKRRDALLKLQRDSILAAEQEKDAIADLVEQGIDLELKSLSDLISKYEESLDSAKDLYQYQKNIEKQTKNIAALRKQISAYAGDTSEENRARVQKLQVSISDAMDELAETQYERYITDQKKLLDDLYNDYELILNQRLDDVDMLMNEMILYANLNAGEIRSTVEGECRDVGISISKSMDNIWANAEQANAYALAVTSDLATKYGDGVIGQISGFLGEFDSYRGDITDKFDGYTGDFDLYRNALMSALDVQGGVLTKYGDGLSESFSGVNDELDNITSQTEALYDLGERNADAEYNNAASISDKVVSESENIVGSIGDSTSSMIDSLIENAEKISSVETAINNLGNTRHYEEAIWSQIATLNNSLSSVLNYVKAIQEAKGGTVTETPVSVPVIAPQEVAPVTTVVETPHVAAVEESNKKKKSSSKKKTSSSSSSSSSSWLQQVGNAIKTAVNTAKTTVSNVASAVKKAASKTKGASDGGFFAEAQRTAYLNGDDIVTINTLKKGEAVLTPGQAAQFKLLAEKLPQLHGMVDTSTTLDMLRKTSYADVGNINYGGFNFTANIDHVQDYNDFVRKLRDDKEYERMMKAMIIDPITGGSSLGKKRFYN